MQRHSIDDLSAKQVGCAISGAFLAYFFVWAVIIFTAAAAIKWAIS